MPCFVVFIMVQTGMSNKKQKIAHYLEANDLLEVANLVVADRKALTHLIRLSYAKDTLVGWRAILAVGMAARELMSTDRAFLRETCRKLLWSLSDESGGIGWSAPELLGEIVSAEPRQFADLVPLIANIYDIEEKVFRPGVVYALRRIAESAPELVLEHQKIVLSSLVDQAPLVRIFGLQLLGQLWEASIRTDLWSPEYRDRLLKAVVQLGQDNREAWIYQEEGFSSILVKDQAGVVLNKIK